MPVIYRGFKFRIFPNKEQEKMIMATFDAVREVHNEMLTHWKNHYNDHGKILNNTPFDYVNNCHFDKNLVDPQAIYTIKPRVVASLKNYVKCKKTKDCFLTKKQSKKCIQRYTTNTYNQKINILNGYLLLPNIGTVKIKQHRTLPSNYSITSVTIRRTPTGKYFASILISYEQAEKRIDFKNVNSKNVIGLDFSLSQFFVSSNGKKTMKPIYKQTERKVVFLKKQLQNCVMNSNRYKKQLLKLNRLQEKVYNQKNDFLHQLSSQIANAYDVVCVEDLDLQKMSQNYSNAIKQNFATFINLLEYKLEQQGKKLIKIDKYFASSQICSICGLKNQNLKDVSIREWNCPSCGTLHDRDINAAVNIKNKGLAVLTA